MAWFKRRIIVDGIRLEGSDARRIVREAMASRSPRARRRTLWWLLSLVIIAGVTCGVVAWITIVLAKRWLMMSPGPMVSPISAFTGAVIGVLWGRVYLRLYRRELRVAMSSLGYELCPSCGYWLKGLPDDVEHCPECGAAREEMTKQATSPPAEAE